jgi:hypothetical protein
MGVLSVAGLLDFAEKCAREICRRALRPDKRKISVVYWSAECGIYLIKESCKRYAGIDGGLESLFEPI